LGGGRIARTCRFTITAPRDVERSGWSDTIENALQRVSSKH
jgi:hypothetical protein